MLLPSSCHIAIAALRLPPCVGEHLIIFLFGFQCISVFRDMQLTDCLGLRYLYNIIAEADGGFGTLFLSFFTFYLTQVNFKMQNLK